jgi:hypothetical protein
MHRILAWLMTGFLVFSCSGLQTRPDCKLRSFGIIDFYNFADTHKTAFVQRVYDGNIVETITSPVRPRTIYRLRLTPGYYYVGVKYEDGKILVSEEPITLSLCGNERVVMKQTTPAKSEPRIRPRRTNGRAEDFALGHREYEPQC